MSSSTDSSNVTSYDVTIAERVIEATLLSAIIVVSVTGNLAIWIIVLKSKVLRTVTNMFMLSLSAADILVSIVNMPVTVVAIIMGYWPFSDAACVTFGFTNMLTLVTSVLSLCNISINRYVMVCRPGCVHRVYTVRNAAVMIAVVFLVSSLLAAAPFYGWGRYTYIPQQSFCFCDWPQNITYALFMIGVCFGVPFTIMLFCNVFICRAVRQSTLKVHSSHIVSRFIFPKPVSSTTNEQNPDVFVHDIRTGGAVVAQRDVSSKTSASELNMAVRQPTQSNRLVPTCGTSGLDTTLKQTTHVDRLMHTINASELNTHPRQVALVHRLTPAVGNTTDVETGIRFATEAGSCDNSTNGVARNSGQRTNRMKEKQSMSSQGRRVEDLRLAKSLILVVVCFILFWLPYCIHMGLSIMYTGHVSRWFQMTVILIGYANSGCNPIIYGLMNKRYASGFRDLFYWFRRSGPA